MRRMQGSASLTGFAAGLLLFSLAGCAPSKPNNASESTTQPAPVDVSRREPPERPTEPMPDYMYSELAEVTAYIGTGLEFRIVGGDSQALRLEVRRYFSRFHDTLTQQYDVRAGSAIGAVERVNDKQSKPLELDFRTDYRVESIGTRQVLVQEQFVEPGYDKDGNFIGNLAKYRDVYKDQLYAIIEHAASGERFKLLQPIY